MPLAILKGAPGAGYTPCLGGGDFEGHRLPMVHTGLCTALSAHRPAQHNSGHHPLLSAQACLVWYSQVQKLPHC